ncbi:MAG: nucleotide exchange factor GrpE, partial [Verrucomicrobiota bacterium]
LFADFDNYKKRTAKERLELIQTAGKEVMTAMLPVADDMERAIKYMNDHFLGSTAALDLLQHIADREKDSIEKDFYLALHREIEEDQETLKKMLADLGKDESKLHQVAGILAEKVSRWKFNHDGLASGELGRLEALEVLSLGIHGKKLLWMLLERLILSYPQWRFVNFSQLTARAEAQFQQVNARRIAEGILALDSDKESSGPSGVAALPEIQYSNGILPIPALVF